MNENILFKEFEFKNQPLSRTLEDVVDKEFDNYIRSKIKFYLNKDAISFFKDNNKLFDTYLASYVRDLLTDNEIFDSNKIVVLLKKTQGKNINLFDYIVNEFYADDSFLGFDFEDTFRVLNKIIERGN